MQNNPYTLLFGKEPVQMISRKALSYNVIDTFCQPVPSQQVYMITGVRGSGKTVFMTEIARKIRQSENWIQVELNPDRDLLQSFAAKLTSTEGLAGIFKKAKINLTLFGLGLEIDGVDPVADLEIAISRMLEALKKNHKRVLICIDEVTNTKEMRTFASAFQILVRQDLPVFLLMTGLYENIDDLQNEKNLTFLYRAPKIELKPLNIETISIQYQKTFSLSREQALEMARMTKGYSFAFQVLGYFTWEAEGNYKLVQEEYRQYLEDYSYEKIWSEMSHGDRRTAYGIAMNPTGKISDIREFLQMDTNHFTPYRTRLIKKGLLDGSVRGYVHFVLPLFSQFICRKIEDEAAM